jgi:hypothetical protein
MWESLIADEEATADSKVDTQGIDIAHKRDLELENGTVVPLSDRDFRDRTSGK